MHGLITGMSHKSTVRAIGRMQIMRPFNVLSAIFYCQNKQLRLRHVSTSPPPPHEVKMSLSINVDLGETLSVLQLSV